MNYFRIVCKKIKFDQLIDLRSEVCMKSLKDQLQFLNLKLISRIYHLIINRLYTLLLLRKV